MRPKAPHPVVDQLTLILLERLNFGQIKNGFPEIFKILSFRVFTSLTYRIVVRFNKIGPVLFLHNL